MTDEEITAALLTRGVNSQNRAEALIGLLLKAGAVKDDRGFWRAFNTGWNMCDDTWHWRGWLTTLLRERRATAAQYLDADDRGFYVSLPDLVTIYRGCSRPRVRGLSWTTDRAIAERFAKGHRSIPVSDAVIAAALVPKAAIFTVSTIRNESEVVVDWRRLRRLEVECFIPSVADAA